MQAWIEESLKNGELFFYIVPAVLLLLLLIVIFWPEKKKKTKEEIEETELDKLIKADKKLKAEIEPVVENKEEPPFKEAGKEIQLFEEKTEESEPEPVQTSPDEEQPTESVQTFHETSLQAATIKSGLEKTKKGGFMSRLIGLFKNSVVDDDLIEELEEILYTADMGVTTVSWLMDLVNKNRSKFTSGDDVKQFLKEQIREVLVANHKPFPEITEKPTIFLMVGVNGAGKTTTIGKLAHKFIAQGKVPMLAAGDTFRAAAVEQLKVWGERNNCTVISDKDGADPASVAFNAVNSAISKNVDVLLVDTAGRLQNRVNLMEELVKINRVIGKAKEGAPHETIIVIDANNGQNALTQAKQFSEAVKVTGIIVTKLDGSAKGGVIIGISKELGLPVYLVGVGEKIEDLRPFDPNEFVEALFE